MKIVSFTGKSGTGKSYRATALAQSRGFDAIIDDGLLIYKGQIVAGTSAKKCASKAAAMRTALFNYEDHRKEVRAAIARYKPEALMIIGTSDKMTNIIAEQLGLHEPEETILLPWGEILCGRKENEIWIRELKSDRLAPVFSYKIRASKILFSPDGRELYAQVAENGRTVWKVFRLQFTYW